MTPFNHVENPTVYGPKTPWLSFSDPDRFPNGVDRFGDTTVFFRVRDFLTDLKKTGNCGNVAILSNRQLAAYFLDKVKANLEGKDPAKISQLIAKLDQLKGQYPLSGSQLAGLQAMLVEMGFSNTKARDRMRVLKAYMHQGANAEMLFYGPVPESYLRIER